MKTVRVVAAIIIENGKVFATQRGYGEFKDGWEFPGGKIEPGETPEEAVVREIKEELDAEVEVVELLDTVEYDYPEFHLSMDCFICKIVSGDLVLKEHEAAKWLTMGTLDSVAWLPADIILINGIRQVLIKSYASFYKSIVDQDRAAVVICNLNHEIIYMNPAAIKAYAKRGGEKLIGMCILDCHNEESKKKIHQVIEWFKEDEKHNIVFTGYNEKHNRDVYMVALRDAGKLIGYYEKHEYRENETMKTYDLWE